MIGRFFDAYGLYVIIGAMAAAWGLATWWRVRRRARGTPTILPRKET